jgi:hypothetical protein
VHAQSVMICDLDAETGTERFERDPQHERRGGRDSDTITALKWRYTVPSRTVGTFAALLRFRKPSWDGPN